MPYKSSEIIRDTIAVKSMSAVTYEGLHPIKNLLPFQNKFTLIKFSDRSEVVSLWQFVRDVS